VPDSERTTVSYSSCPFVFWEYNDHQAEKVVCSCDVSSIVLFCTGYHDDVVAELSTFGVGSNLLTVDPRSEESTMVIREWFATRRLKEATARAVAASSAAAASLGVVSEIGRYDVLFGTLFMNQLLINYAIVCGLFV
jgi:hypothetical protein